MLKGLVNEYNVIGVKWGDMFVVGKIGIIFNLIDLWFVGFLLYFFGFVWIGYDKLIKFMGSFSGCVSFWGKIMVKVYEGMDVKDIEEFIGIIKVDVCKDLGDFFGLLCGCDFRGNRIIEELFIDGIELIMICIIYVVFRGGVYVKKDYLNLVIEDYFVVLGGFGFG